MRKPKPVMTVAAQNDPCGTRMKQASRQARRDGQFTIAWTRTPRRTGAGIPVRVADAPRPCCVAPDMPAVPQEYEAIYSRAADRMRSVTLGVKIVLISAVAPCTGRFLGRI